MTTDESELRAIRVLRGILQDHILDHEPPTSDREWGTIDGLEIAIEETMKLDEKIELRAMTDESERALQDEIWGDTSDSVSDDTTEKVTLSPELPDINRGAVRWIKRILGAIESHHHLYVFWGCIIGIEIADTYNSGIEELGLYLVVLLIACEFVDYLRWGVSRQIDEVISYD